MSSLVKSQRRRNESIPKLFDHPKNNFQQPVRPLLHQSPRSSSGRPQISSDWGSEENDGRDIGDDRERDHGEQWVIDFEIRVIVASFHLTGQSGVRVCEIKKRLHNVSITIILTASHSVLHSIRRIYLISTVRLEQIKIKKNRPPIALPNGRLGRVPHRGRTGEERGPGGLLLFTYCCFCCCFNASLFVVRCEHYHLPDGPIVPSRTSRSIQHRWSRRASDHCEQWPEEKCRERGEHCELNGHDR